MAGAMDGRRESRSEIIRLIAPRCVRQDRSLSGAIVSSDLSHCACRIELQGACDFDELDQVDAAFATLIFGYVALRPAEKVGQLLLREPGLLPSGGEKLYHPDMVGAAQRFQEGLGHSLE
jgi:hypothetical protein